MRLIKERIIKISNTLRSADFGEFLRELFLVNEMQDPFLRCTDAITANSLVVLFVNVHQFALNNR